MLPRLMSRNVEKHITTSIPWKRDLDYMSHFLCFRIDTIIIIQGVPKHWADFVFVIFSGSRAHTGELLTFIQQPWKFAT